LELGNDQIFNLKFFYGLVIRLLQLGLGNFSRLKVFSYNQGNVSHSNSSTFITGGLRVPKNNIESVGGNLIHLRRCANETFVHPGILFKYGVRYSSLRILGDSKGNRINIELFFYGYSMLRNREEPILDLF
jgi:hypothetical protein